VPIRRSPVANIQSPIDVSPPILILRGIRSHQWIYLSAEYPTARQRNAKNIGYTRSARI